MTDKEMLIATFRKMGLVEAEPGKYPSGQEKCPSGDEWGLMEDGSVYLAEGRGYSFFYVEFKFDEDGKFVEHSVME